MRSQRGIVLMDVFGMLVLFAIVGVVFPLLGDTRTAANEAAALETLRAIATAQERHHNRTGTFADSLATLVSEGRIVNPVLGSGVEQGYTFPLLRESEFTWGCAQLRGQLTAQASGRSSSMRLG
jgi:type II secretory pathway pseudopilin PulG